jgi:hypothetical protein
MWRFLSRLFRGWDSPSTRPLNTLLSVGSRHFKTFHSSLDANNTGTPEFSLRPVSLCARLALAIIPAQSCIPSK